MFWILIVKTILIFLGVVYGFRKDAAQADLYTNNKVHPIS